jgi:hypothetical protein
VNTHAEVQQRTLARAFQRAQLTVDELWMRYFALGGEAGLFEVDAYLNGLGDLPGGQRDVLAHAVNERLDELTWVDRASYSRTVREHDLRSRPLAALVHLLEGAELAPPDRLPVLAEAAGRALGVDIAIYLADYDQRHLRPLETDRGTGNRSVLQIDDSPAGQAFRQIRTVSAQSGGRGWLWMPLLDNSERLGVLQIGVPDPAELHDPALRAQCRWISMLIGHLVVLLTQYGDSADLVRLPKPRTVASELVWSMLPPLTAGVDNFVVSGVLEPRDKSSGDAFDYSLSETTASLMILQTAGPGLNRGLIAATAMAAYRGARLAGQGLDGQADAIDEAIGEQFGGKGFVTAVLAEVDLVSRRLRYVNAGHTDPLIMRAGNAIQPLLGGRRPPLGVGKGALAVAEEMLRPDDWLIMTTDGIIKARNENGDVFGDSKLTDILQREAAAGHPLPEAARRLVHAALIHQNGAQCGDATVLLTRWTNASGQAL